MKPGDTIWVRGVIEAPDDDEYPDCVHVAFDESGCSIYLDRREQFVPATRVLDGADVAAMDDLAIVFAHARELAELIDPDKDGVGFDAVNLSRLELQSAIDEAIKHGSQSRLDRILAADAARTEGQQ